MRIFQLFLVAFLIALVAYTVRVISTDGLNLLPVFFGDIAKMAWPGQFNFDFLGFLMLSAIWTAWRNQCSPKGLGLAVLAFFFGMGFLTIYLLYLTFKHAGDMEAVLLGEKMSSTSSPIRAQKT
jgi:hypothetical protein